MTYERAKEIAKKFYEKNKVETFEEMAEFIGEFKKYICAMRVISKAENHGDDSTTLSNEEDIIYKLGEIEELFIGCDPDLR